MNKEIKRWSIEYSNNRGRSGTVEVVEVTTEIMKSGGFQYGNGKSGVLIEESAGYPHGKAYYDLRYNRENDLHMVMIEDYFGKGLVKATEI